MKKSTKIILITSACLIFGGILIAGISGAVGGTRQFKELVDRQALNFDLPWDNAQLKLTTSGLYFTNEEEVPQLPGTPAPSGDSVLAESLKESGGETLIDAPATDIKNIEIELGAGEIELRKSENGTFYVREEENIDIISDYKNGTLKIRSESLGQVQIFGFSTGSVTAGKAVIYFPDQVYEEINMDMGAGTFDGEFPECAKLSIRLGAGECDFDYVKADEIDLEVGAGECKIGRLEAQELNADIAMGEFGAKALIGRELDAKVGMGEITMEIIGEETDFDYDVEVGAGEVRIGSRSYSGVGSGGSQENGVDREINVDCGLGEATINFVED